MNPQQPVYPVYTQPKSNNRKKVIIIALLSLVVIAVVAALIMSKNPKQTPEQAQTQKNEQIAKATTEEFVESVKKKDYEKAVQFFASNSELKPGNAVVYGKLTGKTLNKYLTTFDCAAQSPSTETPKVDTPVTRNMIKIPYLCKPPASDKQSKPTQITFVYYSTDPTKIDNIKYSIDIDKADLEK